MCRKKPIARSGRAARSAAGTSIRWKSCTQTARAAGRMRAIASAKRSLTVDVRSHALSLK